VIRSSTGTLFSPLSAAVRNHRNAVRLASESCPQSVGFRRRAFYRACIRGDDNRYYCSEVCAQVGLQIDFDKVANR